MLGTLFVSLIGTVALWVAFTLRSNWEVRHKVDDLNFRRNKDLGFLLVNESVPKTERFRVLVLQSYRPHLEGVLGLIHAIANAEAVTELIASVNRDALPFMKETLRNANILWDSNPIGLVEELEAGERGLDVDMLVLPTLDWPLHMNIFVPRGIPKHSIVVVGVHIPFASFQRGLPQAARLVPLVSQKRLKLECCASHVTQLLIDKYMNGFNSQVLSLLPPSILETGTAFLDPSDFFTWIPVFPRKRVEDSRGYFRARTVSFVGMVNRRKNTRTFTALFESLTRLKDEIRRQESLNSFRLRIKIVGIPLKSFSVPNVIAHFFEFVKEPDDFDFYALHEDAVGLLPLLPPGGIYFKTRGASVPLVSINTFTPMIATEELIQIYPQFDETTTWIQRPHDQEGDVILRLLSDENLFESLAHKRSNLERLAASQLNKTTYCINQIIAEHTNQSVSKVTY